jgi:hypothetical protein
MVAVATLFVIVGLSVAALVLQGVCSLLNKITPDPHGTDLVPTPRIGKARAVIALAIVVNSFLTTLVYWVSSGRTGFYRPGLSEVVLAFILGFIAMSVAAGRILDAPLWKSAAVMFVPSLIAFNLGFPQLLIESYHSVDPVAKCLGLL